MMNIDVGWCVLWIITEHVVDYYYALCLLSKQP